MGSLGNNFLINCAITAEEVAAHIRAYQNEAKGIEDRMNAADAVAQKLCEMNRMMADDRATMCQQSNKYHPQEQEAPQSHFVTGMSHAPDEEVLACPPQNAPSLALQAEMERDYHQREAAKLEEAAAFLRENPAFDKFVRLVRAGVISLS